MGGAILAIDQGTTGSTALVLSADGAVLGRSTHEFAQHYPEPGWVEHEPEDIWQSVEASIEEATRNAALTPHDFAAIGITNQRETTLLWDKASGLVLHRAIVWQDRRTADRCRSLVEQGHSDRVREVTGLVIDPYFSATKLSWLLDSIPGARARAERGELAFGTIDSYLVWRLAGGAPANAPHVTDVTNASRTLLMNLRTLAWDAEMCELFRVPQAVLPEIRESAGLFAHTRGSKCVADGVVISGVAGDQQAATFGQGCFLNGDIKCTYGTGAFVVMNTGALPRPSRNGLLTTVAWKIGGNVVYALEGSAFIAGAAVQWLRDGLGIIGDSSDIEPLARSVPSSEGVVFVPALSGLGAPHWDADARGLICGITRGTTRAHIARATLEAVAFQVNDLIVAMREDSGLALGSLRVDGGAARNDLLMQFQSDVSGVLVERPSEVETTARGAAMLAGIGAGIFESGQEAARMLRIQDRFSPRLAGADRAKCLKQWHNALKRTKSSMDD